MKLLQWSLTRFVAISMVLTLSTSVFAQGPCVCPLPPLTQPAVDLTHVEAVLQEILNEEKAIHVNTASISKNTAALNHTIGQSIASVGTFVGKYIAPAVLSWLAAKGKL